MSSLTSNEKKDKFAQRGKARRRTKKQFRAQRLALASSAVNSAGPAFGPGSLAQQFVAHLDPTEQEKAEIIYQTAVLDPMNGPKVGIPLSVGGLAPNSLKIKLRMAESAFVNPATGSLTIFAFNCSGPQEGADMAETGNGVLGNKLPLLSKTTAQLRPTMLVGASLTGSTPAWGTTTPYVPGATAWPSLGVDLTNAWGRIVAQEVRVYPTGPTVISQGTAMAIQASTMGTASLNGKTFQEAFGFQAAPRTLTSLAGWNPQNHISIIRVPQDPEDVNWLPMSTNNADPSIPVPGNFADDIWGAFYFEGCQAQQSFLIETIVILEIKNNIFSFGTGNMSSGTGLESVARFPQLRPSMVMSSADAPNVAAAIAAHSAVESKGSPKASGLMNFLSRMGGAFASAAEAILPRLLDTGVSLLSEGLVPPGLVSELAAPLLGSSHQVYPPLAGMAPLALPPPLISNTPRIEVLDEWAKAPQSFRMSSGVDPDAGPSGSQKEEEGSTKPRIHTCERCHARTAVRDIEDVVCRVCGSLPPTGSRTVSRLGSKDGL